MADSISYFADQIIFLDPQLPQSLIAKALFYMAHAEYQLAVPYFEKALEYNPNYDLVYVFLVDLYANYLPDTRKYLEYTLRGLQIDPARFDPVTMSFNFLHISNAFIQAGFVDEAEKFINVSLDYYPGNLYSEYVKAYILFAVQKNFQYWIVLFLPIDPIMDAVKNQAGYSRIFKQIKANFKQFHNEVKESLEEKGLM
ncbi:MAG: tetratricopeptide repeat protein [Draconibacterium sp.]